MLDELLKQYNYEYPKELIANKPASPRDSARLLIYNRQTKEIAFDTYLNLEKYLPKNAVVVFNQTKVIPARLEVKKETGGIVQILFIRRASNSIIAKSNKPLHSGDKLFLRNLQLLTAKTKHVNEGWEFELAVPYKKFESILNKHGSAPLPPYIKDTPLTKSEAKKQYQTVFAKTSGSIAAPTASLHFTQRLMSKLKKAGIKIEFVTLHVGLGTFAPLTEDQIKSGKLHHEYYEIDKSTANRLNKAKAAGRPIIAVGTTSARTLESAAKSGSRIKSRMTELSILSGDTNLFIQEGYKFKFLDGLITNFHVPQSSLIMLVSALAGREETLSLYNLAVANKFKLFSFGDGMLIV